MKAPRAPQRPEALRAHGHEREDPFLWMCDLEDPDTTALIEAEQDYIEDVLAPQQALEAQLFAECKSRIQEVSQSVPYTRKTHSYYSRTEAGAQYRIYCRKPLGEGGKEEILLDGNQMAQGEAYFEIGALSPSPDERALAYSIDTSGDETYEIWIKDLQTGAIVDGPIENTQGEIVWADDASCIFYVTLNDNHQPHTVYRHDCNSPNTKDTLVYEEKDEGFFVSLRKTMDQRYILLEVVGQNQSEVHFIPSETPRAAPRCIERRTPDLEFEVEHREGRFFLLTNADDAHDFKVVSAPVETPTRAHWQDEIPHSLGTYRVEMLLRQDFLALQQRHNATESIAVYRFDDNPLVTAPKHPAALASAGSPSSTASSVSGDAADMTELSRTPLASEEVEVGPHPSRRSSLVQSWNIEASEETAQLWMRDAEEDFSSRLLRVSYESMKTPREIVDIDLASQVRTLRKRQEVPGDFDPEHYETTRVFAPTVDGQEVPLTLLTPKVNIQTPKGLERDGKTPFLLYGYGAYGDASMPDFDTNRFSLVDRGWGWAIAHVRGGSELGDRWYREGKREHKQNSIDDLLACARFLCDEGYTARGKIALAGYSAGGLLVGAAVNQEPALFSAVIAGVPFVDVLTTMLDDQLTLTQIEYNEWGNPSQDEHAYHTILAYSPYDNVTTQAYPPMLLTAGLHDHRVPYWEPLKWTAKLRLHNTSSHPILLHINTDAGHYGTSGRYDYLKEPSREMAFLLSFAS